MTHFFDPREVEREPSIEVVNDGVYLVEVAKVYKKEDNFGLRVKVYYKLLDKSGYSMENFNLGHGNPKVEEIGKQQFTRLLDAVGMGDSPLQSERDILGKKLKIEVALEPHYKDPNSTQNKVKRHLAINPLDIIELKKIKNEAGDIPF